MTQVDRSDNFEEAVHSLLKAIQNLGDRGNDEQWHSLGNNSCI